MPRSVIEAIKDGDLTFEPASADESDLSATAALPGTAEKIDVLAQRVARGEPLFHPCDRLTYRQTDDEA